MFNSAWCAYLSLSCPSHTATWRPGDQPRGLMCSRLCLGLTALRRSPLPTSCRCSARIQAAGVLFKEKNNSGFTPPARCVPRPTHKGLSTYVSLYTSFIDTNWAKIGRMDRSVSGLQGNSRCDGSGSWSSCQKLSTSPGQWDSSNNLSPLT